jgi:hypothetical protein
MHLFIQEEIKQAAFNRTYKECFVLDATQKFADDLYL